MFCSRFGRDDPQSPQTAALADLSEHIDPVADQAIDTEVDQFGHLLGVCLLYTSDAADERSSVDLGGRRIIKKKVEANNNRNQRRQTLK